MGCEPTRGANVSLLFWQDTDDLLGFPRLQTTITLIYNKGNKFIKINSFIINEPLHAELGYSL